MKQAGQKINWSFIACEAFERCLDNKDLLAERLRAKTEAREALQRIEKELKKLAENLKSLQP